MTARSTPSGSTLTRAGPRRPERAACDQCANITANHAMPRHATPRVSCCAACCTACLAGVRWRRPACAGLPQCGLHDGRYAVPCRAVHCRAVPCRAVPCRAEPSRAMPCTAVPCTAVPCRAPRARRAAWDLHLPGSSARWAGGTQSASGWPQSPVPATARGVLWSATGRRVLGCAALRRVGRLCERVCRGRPRTRNRSGHRSSHVNRTWVGFLILKAGFVGARSRRECTCARTRMPSQSLPFILCLRARALAHATKRTPMAHPRPRKPGGKVLAQMWQGRTLAPKAAGWGSTAYIVACGHASAISSVSEGHRPQGSVGSGE
jgi:hypothetical protein